MAAKDYKICTGLVNAYLAKVSKKHPGQMTDDRRVITDETIMGLIVWWARKRLEGTENNVTEISERGKPVVEVKLLD
ncbi:MAG: hypothetical protein II207_01350 [Clostridia bacterium]|nr:hypothetical protein [Clostridia bacterium]